MTTIAELTIVELNDLVEKAVINVQERGFQKGSSDWLKNIMIVVEGQIVSRKLITDKNKEIETTTLTIAKDTKTNVDGIKKSLSNTKEVSEKTQKSVDNIFKITSESKLGKHLAEQKRLKEIALEVKKEWIETYGSPDKLTDERHELLRNLRFMSENAEIAKNKNEKDWSDIKDKLYGKINKLGKIIHVNLPFRTLSARIQSYKKIAKNKILENTVLIRAIGRRLKKPFTLMKNGIDKIKSRVEKMSKLTKLFIGGFKLIILRALLSPFGFALVYVLGRLIIKSKFGQTVVKILVSLWDFLSVTVDFITTMIKNIFSGFGIFGEWLQSSMNVKSANAPSPVSDKKLASVSKTEAKRILTGHVKNYMGLDPEARNKELFKQAVDYGVVSKNVVLSNAYKYKPAGEYEVSQYGQIYERYTEPLTKKEITELSKPLIIPHPDGGTYPIDPTKKPAPPPLFPTQVNSLPSRKNLTDGQQEPSQHMSFVLDAINGVTEQQAILNAQNNAAADETKSLLNELIDRPTPPIVINYTGQDFQMDPAFPGLNQHGQLYTRD